MKYWTKIISSRPPLRFFYNLRAHAPLYPRGIFLDRDCATGIATRVEFSQYEFCTRGKVGEKARGRSRSLIALRYKLSQMRTVKNN